MLEDFEVKPLFEGQPNERQQFSLNIQGDEYQGLYHEGEIQWFQPHPSEHFQEEHLKTIENKVHEVMTNRLE